MKMLHLTLKRLPFEVMASGEKKFEYRKPSKWIESRLLDKQGNPRQYDYVKFTNGYGKDKPYFIAEYIKFIQRSINSIISYSNGLQVEVHSDDYWIYLGKIIEKKL